MPARTVVAGWSTALVTNLHPGVTVEEIFYEFNLHAPVLQVVLRCLPDGKFCVFNFRFQFRLFFFLFTLPGSFDHSFSSFVFLKENDKYSAFVRFVDVDGMKLAIAKVHDQVPITGGVDKFHVVYHNDPRPVVVFQGDVIPIHVRGVNPSKPVEFLPHLFEPKGNVVFANRLPGLRHHHYGATIVNILGQDDVSSPEFDTCFVFLSVCLAIYFRFEFFIFLYSIFLVQQFV